MTRPVHQLSRLFQLLRRGDALVGTQQAEGRTWALARDGRPVEPDIAAILVKRHFQGGRLVPGGDHLPGFEDAGSQSWTWQASTRPHPRNQKPQVAKPAAAKPPPPPPQVRPGRRRPGDAPVMRQTLSLAAWAGLKPMRMPRRARQPLTPEQLAEIATERAYRCGFRYFSRRWPRRSPPRFAWVPYSHPDSELRAACRAAFIRGYDAGSRAEQARRRQWAVTWAVEPAA